MCAVVCHWQWNGANIILLTGLRPAAMEARQTRDKQALFICLSCTHTRTYTKITMSASRTNNLPHKHFDTAWVHCYCSLIARLSSAELWRKPIEDVYTGKEWAGRIIKTPSFIKCSANAHAHCAAHHLIFKVCFFYSYCPHLTSAGLRDRFEKGCIQSFPF